MIKLVEWLLGQHRAEELRTERAEAERDVAVSRTLRHNAERLGPALRAELAVNHFGERMAAALEPRGQGS